jgi:hypothetical protein
LRAPDGESSRVKGTVFWLRLWIVCRPRLLSALMKWKSCTR